MGYEKLKRYNFKREGKAEGVFIHADSLEEAILKAQKIASIMPCAKLIFVDNKPCSKNVGCYYCLKGN